MSTELERRLKEAAEAETSNLTLRNPRTSSVGVGDSRSDADGTGTAEAELQSLCDQKRSRRTWTGLAIAAVAAAVIAIAVGIDLRGDTGHVAAVPADDPGSAQYFMPSAWPEGSGVDGDIETWRMSDFAQGDGHNAGAILLTLNGVASAFAITSTYPPGGGPWEVPESHEQPLQSLPDGRRILGYDRSGGALTMQVELGEGRTLVLSSNRVDESQLRTVAGAFDVESGMIDRSAFTGGWDALADPTGVATLSFGAHPIDPEPWTSVSRSGGGSDGAFKNVVLFARSLEDAQAQTDRIEMLAGGDAQTVKLPGGRGFVLPTLVQGIRSLVWSPADGVVAVLSGEGVSDDELLATASSVKPVSAEEWNSHRMEIPELSDGQSPMCEALAAHPSDLPTVRWSNGLTQSAATWGVVLSPDLFRLSEESLSEVAEAVSSDAAGFERLRGLVDGDAVKGALDHMRALASNPESVDRAGETAESQNASAVVRRLNTDCGFF